MREGDLLPSLFREISDLPQRVISFSCSSTPQKQSLNYQLLLPQQCGLSLSLSSQTITITCHKHNPHYHSTTTPRPATITARLQDKTSDQKSLTRGTMTTRTCSGPISTIHMIPTMGLAVLESTSQNRMHGRVQRRPQLRGMPVVRILLHRELRPLGIGIRDSKVKDQVSSNKEISVHRWAMLKDV